MSRNWGVALLVACADVFTATFWPAPVNGLTVLFILFVDAALWIALFAVPRIIAAYRHQAEILSRPAPAGSEVARRREQLLRDMQRIRDNQVFLTVAAVRGER